MNIYEWPAGVCPRSFRLALQPNNLSYRSRYTQSRQTVDLYGEKWLAFVGFDERSLEAGAEYEAFLARLRGSANAFYMWHFARPVPQGTLRGSRIVAANVLVGANTATLNAPNGSTLLPGDVVGVAGQLMMVAEPAVAAGSLMPVVFVNRFRKAIVGGEPAVLDKPLGLFALTDEVVGVTYSGFKTDQFEIACEEVW
jgi:hypothetical protein